MRVCLFKSIVFQAMLFFVSSWSMQHNNLINGGLFPILMPREIIEEHIKPYFDFQDICRLRLVNRELHCYWNPSRYCPDGQAITCFSIGCIRLRNDREACDIALVHFAHKDNRKMFRHLWYFHGKVRDKAVTEILDIKKPSLTDRMNVYRGLTANEELMLNVRSSQLIALLCNHNTVAIHMLLLGKNFNISYEEYNRTLLDYICMHGNIRILLTVLTGDERINTVDKYGKNAVHYSLAGHNERLFFDLLAQGANVNIPDATGRTVLHNAVKRSPVDTVRLLCTKGADINARGVHGKTSIHYACNHQRYEVLKILLDHGASIDSVDHYLNTVLHCALKNKMEYEAIRLLVGNQAPVNSVDVTGATPLHCAVLNVKQACNTNPRWNPVDELEIITLLLKNGSYVDIRNVAGNTVFNLIAGMRNKEMKKKLKLLLKTGSKKPN